MSIRLTRGNPRDAHSVPGVAAFSDHIGVEMTSRMTRTVAGFIRDVMFAGTTADTADAIGAEGGAGATEVVDLPVAAFGDNADVKYQAVTVPQQKTVGFRATRADGRVEYLMLNPSTTDGEEDYTPCVFVYQGETGDVAIDRAADYHDLFEAGGAA